MKKKTKWKEHKNAIFALLVFPLTSKAKTYSLPPSSTQREKEKNNTTASTKHVS